MYPIYRRIVVKVARLSKVFLILYVLSLYIQELTYRIYPQNPFITLFQGRSLTICFSFLKSIYFLPSLYPTHIPPGLYTHRPIYVPRRYAVLFFSYLLIIYIQIYIHRYVLPCSRDIYPYRYSHLAYSR
jgi:hypothetical protein